MGQVSIFIQKCGSSPGSPVPNCLESPMIPEIQANLATGDPSSAISPHPPNFLRYPRRKPTRFGPGHDNPGLVDPLTIPFDMVAFHAPREEGVVDPHQIFQPVQETGLVDTPHVDLIQSRGYGSHHLGQFLLEKKENSTLGGGRAQGVVIMALEMSFGSAGAMGTGEGLPFRRRIFSIMFVFSDS